MGITSIGRLVFRATGVMSNRGLKKNAKVFGEKSAIIFKKMAQ